MFKALYNTEEGLSLSTTAIWGHLIGCGSSPVYCGQFNSISASTDASSRLPLEAVTTKNISRYY